MNTMIMWGGYAVAVIVAGAATIILQKKSGGNKEDFERAEELSAQLSLLERELREARESLVVKEQEIKAVQQERDEKAATLEALENDFESKKDDIVQASIQKLSHAEQSKENAIQAAEDNYEAAAEAYALLKEKEKIIAELQQQLKG